PLHAPIEPPSKAPEVSGAAGRALVGDDARPAGGVPGGDMPRTSFTPPQHGFHFGNDFVNRTATLPGFGEIETRGRCGGMAFAALDLYHAGMAAPPDTTLPPDGHPLADYIYRRLLDSFLVPSAFQFLSWTLHAD